MADGYVELQPPLAGYDASLSFQRAAPFTSARLLNVYPEDDLAERERIGRRSGYDRYLSAIPSYATYPPEAGAETRMLSSVGYIDSNGRTVFHDRFDLLILNTLTIASEWATATWLDASSPTPYTYWGGSGVSTTNGQNRGLIRTIPVGARTPSGSSLLNHVVEIFIVPWDGEHRGTYRVWTGVDPSNPVTTEGLELRFTITGATGSYSGAVQKFGTNAASGSLTSGSDGAALPGWLTFIINGTSVGVYWRGKPLNATFTLAAALAKTNNRAGFALDCSAGDRCLVDAYRYQYYDQPSGVAIPSARRKIVAGIGGYLFNEEFLGQWTVVADGPHLASTNLVHSAEYLQNLYIADSNEGAAVTNYTAEHGVGGDSFANVDDDEWDLTDASQSFPANATRYAIRITASESDPFLVGTHQITTRISGTTIRIRKGVGATVTTTGSPQITYQLVRPPIVYDPLTATAIPWTAEYYDSTLGYLPKGEVPVGNDIVVQWGGRTVLSGNPKWAYYASRDGNPNDFDFGFNSDDPLRAFGGDSETGGRVGDDINAMIPRSEDYLMFGCANSIRELVGNPTLSGGARVLSNVIGCLSQGAWCADPDGGVYFLSRNGLHYVQPGAGAFPVDASARLPRELADIDVSSYRILMACEPRRRRIHIYLTPRQSVSVGAKQHWWFDLKRRGFWPVSISDSDIVPTAIHHYQAQAAPDSCVLLGGRAAFLYRFHPAFITDAGTNIESSALYGPINIGAIDGDGLVTDLSLQLSENGAGVDVSVFGGRTAEQAVGSDPFTENVTTGEFAAGLNRRIHPRVRGSAFAVELQENSGGPPWSVESLGVRVMRLGTLR